MVRLTNALVVELKNEAGNQIDDPPLERLDRLLIIFAEESQIVENQALLLRRTRIEIENGTDRCTELVERRGVFRDGRFDVRDHLPHMLVEDCKQNGFLGNEVVIQRAARELASFRKDCSSPPSKFDLDSAV